MVYIRVFGIYKVRRDMFQNLGVTPESVGAQRFQDTRDMCDMLGKYIKAACAATCHAVAILEETRVTCWGS